MKQAWQEHNAQAKESPPETPIPWPWLTFEVAIYTLLVCLGLVMRLAALGRWPLLEPEVNTALAAWRTVQGSDWRPAYYLPLLYNTHLLLFFLTRATDAATRLLPALVGAGLVLVPYFARDILGRKASLMVAVLWAFAPTWVFFSRTADGSLLAAAASALLLLAAYRAVQSGRPQDFRWVAVALALGLTTGPGFYTTLLALLLYGLFAWGRGRKANWLAQARVQARGLITRENMLLFLGLFLFVSSGFLVNLAGIGASIELFGYWMRSLAPSQSGLPWWNYPQMLLLYEALTLALAVAGAAWGLRRRQALDVFLVGWVGVALVLGTLLGHRESNWLPDILLPLVILAGRGLEQLWDALVPEASLLDGIIIVLVLPFIAFGFLGVIQYIQTGQDKYLTYAQICGGLLILFWLVYLIWGQRRQALRVGAALLLLLLVGITARATVLVAYQTARDPREMMAYRPTSVQIRDFERLVTTLSSRQAGDPHLMTIAYEASLDPWMSWYLRDYPNAQAVASLGTQPEAMALVTSKRPKAEWPQGYMGQRFRLFETWQGDNLSSKDRLRWLIYRAPVGTVQGTEVEVWVRPPTGK
jgi:uncharacterized protein (TIGR03663 family)